MVSLLILISTLLGGGSEKVTSDLYNNIPKDYDCQLIIREKTVSKYMIGDNVNIPIYLHKDKPTSLPYYMWRLYIIPNDIIKYIYNIIHFRPDVSLSMLPIDNIINIIACKLTSTHPIISIRGNPDSNSHSRLILAFMRFIIFLCRIFAIKIITNSTDIKKLLSTTYRIRSNLIEVIYNPKNIQQIQALQKVEITDDFFNTSIPVIITMGRLTKIKGHDHLIRIFADLHREIPCRLVFCGVGELQDCLEHMAVDLHVRDDVLFLGWSENPYKYISRSTVFVLSSLSEAQPNAMIEAMICGCPVVASDCNYGPREILDGGKYGLLSKPFLENIYDVKLPLTIAEMEMENNIRSVIMDREIREYWANQGLLRAEIFDKEKIIKQYLDVIQAVARS